MGAANSPFWQAKADAIGQTVVGLDDLDQCIRTILCCPLGSVPLEPEFGCALQNYLDLPTPQAVPAIIRAITKALQRWEPRIELGPIECRREAAHKLRLCLSWRPSSPEGQAAFVKTEVLWA